MPEVTRRVGGSRIWKRAARGGARVLPPALLRAAGAERRAGRKPKGGGVAAEDGHLKWPLRD